MSGRNLKIISSARPTIQFTVSIDMSWLSLSPKVPKAERRLFCSINIFLLILTCFLNIVIQGGKTYQINNHVDETFPWKKLEDYPLIRHCDWQNAGPHSKPDELGCLRRCLGLLAMASLQLRTNFSHHIHLKIFALVPVFWHKLSRLGAKLWGHYCQIFA